MANEAPKKLKQVMVYDKLYGLIKNGSFPPGYQFPSEPELADKMGVSRVTLRRALALLHEDGLVINVRGKGNFVADPQTASISTEYVKRVQHPFHACCRNKCEKVELAFRFEPPTNYLLEMLKRDTAVVIIADRFYKIGKSAIGYTMTCLPVEVVSEYKIDLNDSTSLTDFLETEIYKQSLRTETQFTYTTTGNQNAEKYKLSSKDQFILIVETLYSIDNIALLTNKHYIPVDQFKLNINVSDKFEL